ncbi:unnamed protein product [Plutella xylostella]|uniref:RNA-directed DNA polymerase n=1 Tax=Plutella xylostella TaxID=51655 RepID=A0A8S4EQ39_PLUXY|nr:unnamed protein product [Plutella xylostella]
MSAFNLVLTTNLNKIYTDGEVGTLLEQYPELWRDELGTFNKFKVDLRLKDNAVPKFFKPRTVSFALKDKVEAELDRLVSLGILVPVNHSNYATPVVPVLKENGQVKIAGDYSVTLNKDLLVDKYPLPRIEEVFAKLGGGEKYTKLHLKNAYNQYVLNEPSQELTTINTSKGLFKYTRMVYGLASAPAIFQKSMETVLSGIEGVSCWYDDICITGPNKATHLARLREVLHRLNSSGLRLQKDKCEFFKDSVTYLGYVIDKNGLQTCPKKVEAILKAPEPKNVTEVKRFLGVVNYYRNFIPNASAVMSPLHELLKAGAAWQWGARQRQAVAAVRRELASERVLAHFNPAAQLVLAVDAGPHGLGAVLLQRAQDGSERPLAYGSRSLNASERNYSQIQKEATAIIFGVKRFHQYLYGRSDPFILQTDHRPLVSIFNKNSGISVTTALRLQRYAIILSAYNYVIQYTSSANNVVADFFSRAPVSETVSDSDGEFDMYTSLKFLDESTPAVLLNDIRRATDNDEVLKIVIKYMQHGWPRSVHCQSVLPYFRCKADLQYEKGYLLRGHKVIIPSSLRERMLVELHSTHLGVVKMKCNARARMWWPGIDADIERCVGACGTCVSVRAAPPREPPAPWPRPAGPWQRVHIDYMSLGQSVYLVVVDSYSKWVECLLMNNGTSTSALISKLKYLFSVFGICNTLVSDNDAKINSSQFREFCSNNGIKYMTSPIYHPASNGQAENAVRMCKKMIKCAIGENLPQKIISERLLDYVFVYRNTEHCSTGEPPAKLMFGRNLRSRLDLILPKEDKSCVNEQPISKRKFNEGSSVTANRSAQYQSVSMPLAFPSPTVHTEAPVPSAVAGDPPVEQIVEKEGHVECCERGISDPNTSDHPDPLTSYTTAAYGSHQNVLLRLDTMGRPPSSTGSYATIASLHKFPFGSRRSPSPYATTHIGEHVYAKPESRVSYYAASNLTHVSQPTRLTISPAAARPTPALGPHNAIMPPSPASISTCSNSLFGQSKRRTNSMPTTNTLKDRITDPAEQLRHLTAPRANIRLEILVHEGTFGRVYKGVFKRGDTYEEVLVKTVSDNASAMQAALLVAEGLRLYGLSHANVLAPAAACAEEARRPLLVYVCASHSSNLKRFLTSCRLGQQAAPATRELVELGAQVACGLSYLHVQRLIHADVAARNCVVDEKLRLKLADNGLSRDLFPEEYHCLGDNENRPVKWMAPETILQCQYTSASDVWSLGVTLWELATLGAPPLAELDAADVGAFLSGGYRPAQPHNCPDELYGLMSWCWTSAAAGRPTAPQLLAALHDFRQALNTYI